MKDKWTKPELTVLTRNKPEEAVLTVCKNGVGGGPDDLDNVCSSAAYACEDWCYSDSSS